MPEYRAAPRQGRFRTWKRTAIDLLIGTRHITRTATGVEAVLHGDALMCLLDAAFHGDGTIEILGGGSNCHQMEVTEIAMQGRDSWVSLAAMGETLRLM